jgi:AcrR family transcriptional regulator
MRKRTYNSRRRAESAERTRQAIVEAAVKMHSQGITTLAAVAEEAGVSLPTVNKYFPTREDLFTACTSHVAATMAYPPIESLAAISDLAERIHQTVREAYQLNEATFGTAWTGYMLEDESPTMARAMQDYEALLNAMADLLLPDGAEPAQQAFVRALISPLTYRALRLKNQLSQEKAVQHSAQALICVLTK